MAELNLINPGHERLPQLGHNASGKFESNFISVEVTENNSVMLQSLTGHKLGIWVAHGEGRFDLPYEESKYNIPVKYNQSTYPANPNGSMFDTAALCSDDGRHLAIMPHLERSFMPWQCGTYPEGRRKDDVTPWIEAFINAKKWVESKTE
jgi:phosphoribosylformylglycinamidine synthase